MRPFTTLSCLTISSDPELASVCNEVLTRLNFENRLCKSEQVAAEELRCRNFDLVIVDSDQDASARITSSMTGLRKPAILKIVDVVPSSNKHNIESGTYYVETPVRFDRLAAAVSSVRGIVMKEKREHTRWATLLNTTIKIHDGSEIFGRALDLSEAGARITMEKTVNVHDALELTIALAPSMQIRIEARVAWAGEHNQIGTRFTNMNADDFKVLRAWLSKQAH